MTDLGEGEGLDRVEPHTKVKYTNLIWYHIPSCPVRAWYTSVTGKCEAICEEAEVSYIFEYASQKLFSDGQAVDWIVNWQTHNSIEI